MFRAAGPLFFEETGRHLETVIMIQSGDLQLNLGSGFDVNRRQGILVFLGVQFNDLDLLLLGRG